jgi:hypothetical protein
MRELILAVSIYVALGLCILGQMGVGGFPFDWIEKPPKLKQEIAIVLLWPLAIVWAFVRKHR